MLNIGVRLSVLPSCKLPMIHLVVLLLELPHFLDFVKVNDEAGFKIVEIFDALSTENTWMLTAVEVLDALLVLLTHVRGEVSFICLIVLIQVWVS